jgi:AraC-like DNA-binding protein
MKTQTQSLAIDSESTVDVQLSLKPSDLSQVVPYLISCQIAFSIDYKSSKASIPPSSIHIVSQVSSLINEDKDTPSTIRVVREIYKDYIENFDPQYTPVESEIATKYNLNVFTFKATFKRYYGKTFYQVYMDKRMDYAALLLREGHSASKVTQMVGYGKNSAIKFNKMFQKHLGVTPKKYQMSHFGSLNKRQNKRTIPSSRV